MHCSSAFFQPKKSSLDVIRIPVVNRTAIFCHDRHRIAVSGIDDAILLAVCGSLDHPNIRIRKWVVSHDKGRMYDITS